MNPLIVLLLSIPALAAAVLWWCASDSQRPAQPPPPEPPHDPIVTVPEGLTRVAARRIPRSRKHQTRRLTILAAGSYGTSLLKQLVHAYDLAELLDVIGVVLVVTFDQGEQADLAAFLRDYPELAARVEFCDSTLLPLGLHGLSVHEALAPRLRGIWQTEVARTLTAALPVIRGTEHPTFDLSDPLQAPYDPALVLVLASPGGHLATVLFAADLLHRLCPEARYFLVSELSVHTQLRQQFAEGFTAASALGFVQLTMLFDERKGRAACDRACVDAWTGILADDQAVNLLRRLGHGQPGGVIVPRVWTVRLPAKPALHDPDQWFTFRESLVRGVLAGAEAVLRPESKLIDLATRRAGTERVLIVKLPLAGADLRRFQVEVTPMLERGGLLDHDTSVAWLSTRVPLGPGTREFELSVTALEGAVDGYATTLSLAAGR